METDNYEELAQRYDWMTSVNPVRKMFFQTIFEKYNVKSVLDCACGTGSDLLMFNSMGVDISGSDISDGMLTVAQQKIAQSGQKINLNKADFLKLGESFNNRFDAIVCLSSSICEIHSDEDVLTAIKSMEEQLNPSGIVVIDQGQSDKFMVNKPRFIPVANTRDFTRLFVLDYDDPFVTVNINDFEHSESKDTFSVRPIKLKVRRIDEWKSLFKSTGFSSINLYGGWDLSGYDINSSDRIIVVAQK
jgi:ubiquinone/menaquinone biosynthesis C-methylase UbiE